MAKRLNEYEINAIVEMSVSIKINAETFADALEKAKTLREVDFCKPLGDYLDGNIKISGIYDRQIEMLHEK